MSDLEELAEDDRVEQSEVKSNTETSSSQIAEPSLGKRLGQLEGDVRKIEVSLEKIEHSREHAEAVQEETLTRLKHLAKQLGSNADPSNVHSITQGTEVIERLRQDADHLNAEAIALRGEISKIEATGYPEVSLEHRASPEQVAGACTETIELVLKSEFIPEEKRAVLARWAEYVQQSAARRPLNGDDARKLSIATVGLLDILVVDNIKSGGRLPGSEAELQTEYRRSGGSLLSKYVSYRKIKDIMGQEKEQNEEMFFITPGEEDVLEKKLKQAMEELSQRATFPLRTTEDAKVFLDDVRGEAQGMFHLATPLSVSEFMEIKPMLDQAAAKKRLAAFLQVRLNDGISSYFVYEGGFSTGRLTKETLEQHSGRASNIPTQDRWLAFIENGCVPWFVGGPQGVMKDRSILESAKPISQNSEEPAGVASVPGQMQSPEKFVGELLSGQNLKRWQEYSARKLQVFMKSENPEIIAGALEKHEAHYRKFFSRKGEPEPQVFLTRGGFSANEVAINTINDLADPNDRQAIMLDGWYYENKESIFDNFDKAPDEESANVLFVNSAPNGFVNPELGEHYPEVRDGLLKRFVQNAAAHPDRKYFVVVDKTTDLFYNPTAGASELPKNLHLFETSSITKNQRGGHNYFFGTVEYRGTEDHEQLIRQEIKKSRGELSPMAILNFPRLRHSEIEQRTEHFKKLEGKFLEGLNEAQAHLSLDARWTIQENNGFCMLMVPPFKRLLELTKSGERLREYMSETAYTAKYIDDRFAGPLKELGVIEGDSFGLDEGRYTNIRAYLPPEFGVREGWRSDMEGGDKFSFPRISFGTENTEEQAKQLGLFMGRTLIQNFPKEFTNPQRQEENSEQ